ncbi:hypothetical protein niasHT_029776 [Heterodera trifolii]|uniref:SET domain-containing protein n=1 Tax=Heterodera trifolii TaxID=157864 RepID=A0ABD2KQU8_9BILA
MRLKQLACKSTGGRAPRKQTAYKCAGGRPAKRSFFITQWKMKKVVNEDLSNGKELNKLRVLNTYNDEEMDSFEYITGTEKGENVVDIPNINGPIMRPSGRYQVYFKDPEIGWALQTLEDIDAGTPLFEYAGILDNCKSVGTIAENDDYILAFKHNGHRYQLDAFRKGNMARFVNHSCQPNCCALLTTTTTSTDDANSDQKEVPSVLVYALRRIFAGEELTMDYGERWWIAKADSDSLNCQCGSEECKYDEDWCADADKNGAIAHIKTGQSIGQWSGMDKKLTDDQLEEFLDEETDEEEDEYDEMEANGEEKTTQ